MRITQLEGNKEEEEGIGTFGKVLPQESARVCRDPKVLQVRRLRLHLRCEYLS